MYFHQRGYPVSITDSALKKVQSLSRDACIDSHNNNNAQTRPILTLTYHPFANKVKNIIYKYFNLLSSSDDTNVIFNEPPLTAWRRDTNLKDILVHTVDNDKEGLAGSFPCNRSRCGTCPYIVNTSHIFGPKGNMAVSGTFTCISTNVIYCISCLKCGFLYIGSTVRRLGDRFVEHLRLTRLNDIHFPVSIHFNSDDHNVSHMSISVICQVSGSVEQLRQREEKIIYHLGTLQPFGMNRLFNAFPISV